MRPGYEQLAEMFEAQRNEAFETYLAEELPQPMTLESRALLKRAFDAGFQAGGRIVADRIEELLTGSVT